MADSIFNSTPTQAPAPVPPPEKTPRITPKVENKKLFSGGFISDVFDVLRLPEYALAGFTKSGIEKRKELQASGAAPQKGFVGFQNLAPILGSAFKGIKPGIMNTQEYGSRPQDLNIGKELNIKNPKLQQAYNFGLSLAAPNLPISKTAKAINKIPGVSGLVSKGSKVLDFFGDLIKGSPTASKIVETFKPGFKVPKAVKFMEEAKQTANLKINQLHRFIAEAADNMTPAMQKRVGQLMEGGISISERESNLAKIANMMNELADDIGREGVKLWEETGGKIGLNPDSFEKFKGQYLPHIWKEMKEKGNVDFITKGAPKIFTDFWKKRKGAEGYIKEFAPASFKGLGTQTGSIEIAKGYLNVLKEFGEETAKEGLVKLGNVGGDAGKLFKDVFVPQEVADYIKATINIPAYTIFDKALNMWKKGKTIWNPAYHIRNIVSNQILSDMATGRGLINTTLDYFKAVDQYRGKGTQKFVEAAEDIGLIRQGSFVEYLDELMNSARLSDSGNLSKVGDWMKKFQDVSEDTAKLNVFTNTIEELADEVGIAVDAALKDKGILKKAMDLAEQAIFSPYKIGDAERHLTRRLIPFYSFGRQALPFTLKTAAENPQRLTKYDKFKTGIEGFLPEGEYVPDEDRPDWQQKTIQTPLKFKGEPIAFDPQYLYPFSGFDTESGDILSKGQAPFGLSLNPFAMELAQQIGDEGRDFYFDQPLAPSKLPGFSLADAVSTKPRQEGSQRFAHAANTLLPSLYRTYFGKVKPALESVPDYAGRDRSVWMALFDAFGIKSTILRPDDKKMFEIIDDKQELKQIKSQMYSIAADEQLTDEQKQQYLNDYAKQIELLFQE